MGALSITKDAVDAFASASHDRNPLHVDPSYARRTSFGHPVAFGILTLLEAMAHLSPRARGSVLAKVTADFQGPAFEGLTYDVALEETADRAKIVVRDGTRTILRATLRFAQGDAPEVAVHAPAAPRTSARADATAAGQTFEGPYAPRRAELAAIAEGLGLPSRGVGEAAVAALMAASYVVGMERPGEPALFSRLDLAFGPHAPPRIAGRVAAFDERFAMATLEVELGCAKGELRALQRPPAIEIDPSRFGPLPAPDALRGKLAVVVGGGRGLGAALALALARTGADVVATYRAGRDTADRLAALDARIRVEQADAGSVEACARVRDSLDGRAIDVLVVSASPPVLPLAVGDSTAPRARAFIDSSVSMVLAPVTAFGPALAKDARLVVVSSSYAVAPPTDFAHYAAAKGAVEGLLRGVARDRGLALLIVRPPRVLTDMTNTAFGAEDALPVEPVAAQIVTTLVAHQEGVAVLDGFAAAS